jgi:hypothetical protein
MIISHRLVAAVRPFVAAVSVRHRAAVDSRASIRSGSARSRCPPQSVGFPKPLSDEVPTRERLGRLTFIRSLHRPKVAEAVSLAPGPGELVLPDCSNSDRGSNNLPVFRPGRHVSADGVVNKPSRRIDGPILSAPTSRGKPSRQPGDTLWHSAKSDYNSGLPGKRFLSSDRDPR